MLRFKRFCVVLINSRFSNTEIYSLMCTMLLQCMVFFSEPYTQKCLCHCYVTMFYEHSDYHDINTLTSESDTYGRSVPFCFNIIIDYGKHYYDTQFH